MRESERERDDGAAASLRDQPGRGKTVKNVDLSLRNSLWTPAPSWTYAFKWANISTCIYKNIKSMLRKRRVNLSNSVHLYMTGEHRSMLIKSTVQNRYWTYQCNLRWFERVYCSYLKTVLSQNIARNNKSINSIYVINFISQTKKWT